MTAAERTYCREPHDWGPLDVDEYLRWAQDRSTTHEQLECPDCRLWVIWRPKSAPSAEGEQEALL